jgi:hypothetical protein
MSLRSEAALIHSRLTLAYTRASFVAVRDRLSRGECDQLSYRRPIVTFEEFSQLWNRHGGAQP